MKKNFINLHTDLSISSGSSQSHILPSCLILLLTAIFMLYYLLSGFTIPVDAPLHNFSNSSDSNTQVSKELQESIASEIIRFHVIANSDSKEDQELKLIVKDALTEALRPYLEKARDLSEARSILQDRLPELVTISNDIIQDHGFTYTASATLERGYFPLKVYGDLSLPPGEYEAVRVELGSAQGKNWWCIMFPPLCFVDATYSVVPDSSKEELKYLLTDEEYNALFSKDEVKVKVSFKLFSLLEDIFSAKK